MDFRRIIIQLTVSFNLEYITRDNPKPAYKGISILTLLCIN